MNRFEKRLERFRAEMEEKEWSATFLAPSGDMEYLIGVRRQRPNATQSHMHGDWLYGAFVTPTECAIVAPLLAHHFTEEQAANKPWITDVVKMEEGADVPGVAEQILDRFNLRGKAIGIPREGLASSITEIQRIAPGTTFHTTWEITGPMRAIKDDEEIELMRRASLVTDQIFDAVLNKLSYGMNGLDIMSEVEYQMLKHNTEGSSFVTGIMIQGEGAGESLEGIGRAGADELKPGRVLAFDFGVVLDGYVSDFGRTIHCGEPDEELRRIHDLVMAAQATGISSMKAGQVTAEQVDRTARQVIEEAGYGPNFFHRLGHGIGIDVHEPPFLAHGDSTKLEANMCFTVEPSIWVHGRCFTRVEDIVVVGENGGTSLNQTTRDVLVI